MRGGGGGGGGVQCVLIGTFESVFIMHSIRFGFGFVRGKHRFSVVNVPFCCIYCGEHSLLHRADTHEP